MSGGHQAMIGNGESVAHVLADRDRLKLALEIELPAEKRAEIEAKLAGVEAQLAEIRAAIG